MLENFDSPSTSATNSDASTRPDSYAAAVAEEPAPEIVPPVPITWIVGFPLIIVPS